MSWLPFTNAKGLEIGRENGYGRVSPRRLSGFSFYRPEAGS
jgi:hypothetical protein